jgi:hypothetical protein
MNLVLDHVSVLVHSVDATAKLIADSGVHAGEKESFGDVGTEEIYLGDPESRALLLLQAAVLDGAYKRALEKREPASITLPSPPITLSLRMKNWLAWAGLFILQVSGSTQREAPYCMPGRAFMRCLS